MLRGTTLVGHEFLFGAAKQRGLTQALDDMERSVATPFSNCRPTSIQSELLEAIVVNKRRIYPQMNPVTSGGHSRSSDARHILTYVLASALNLHRRPGALDLDLDRSRFESFSDQALEDAITDAKRIYVHGQKEMAKVGTSMHLRRGLREPESSVAYTLAQNTKFPIRLPFQTFAFFNHLKSPFYGEAILNIDAPIKWIWASEYTLTDLQISSTDEEIIVVIDSLDGCMPLQENQIIFESGARELEITNRQEVSRECLGQLFSGEKVVHTTEMRYTGGPFERVGRKLDNVLRMPARITLTKKADVI